MLMMAIVCTDMSSDTSRSDVEWCEDVDPNKVVDSVSDTTRGTDGTVEPTVSHVCCVTHCKPTVRQ
jgi:hypothetical protein